MHTQLQGSLSNVYLRGAWQRHGARRRLAALRERHFRLKVPLVIDVHEPLVGAIGDDELSWEPEEGLTANQRLEFTYCKECTAGILIYILMYRGSAEIECGVLNLIGSLVVLPLPPKDSRYLPVILSNLWIHDVP